MGPCVELPHFRQLLVVQLHQRRPFPRQARVDLTELGELDKVDDPLHQRREVSSLITGDEVVPHADFAVAAGVETIYCFWN
ncbi:head or portal protein [Xanthomonas phage vB_XooS_NR08]|nr:head or portal protein [Xanthomonas phage vB_XooS_NR08]